MSNPKDSPPLPAPAGSAFSQRCGTCVHWQRGVEGCGTCQLHEMPTMEFHGAMCFDHEAAPNDNPSGGGE